MATFERMYFEFDESRPIMVLISNFREVLQKYAAPENTLPPLDVEKVANKMALYVGSFLQNEIPSVKELKDAFIPELSKYGTPKVTKEEVKRYFEENDVCVSLGQENRFVTGTMDFLKSKGLLAE